jgi:hypothetical protein
VLEHFAVDVDLVVRTLLGRVSCCTHAMSVYAEKDTEDEGYRCSEKRDLEALGHSAGTGSDIGLTFSFELPHI